MITIRTGRLQPEAGTGPRTTIETLFFDREIRDCWVALAGYRLEYLDDDHHVRNITVDLSANVQDTEFGRGVVVGVSLLLRDQNGDDSFAGWADYVLFVDLGAPLLVVDSGAARGGLVVNG